MNAIKALKLQTIDEMPKLADPFVFRVEQSYIAIGTGWAGMPVGQGVFPALFSDDFKRWQEAGFVEMPRVEGHWNHYWAPEIVFSDGLFFLYFSLGTSSERFEIRVATSVSPLGPYRVESKPVLDPRRCPFAIDAHPYKHSDGNWYLYYARDFLDGERPGTALAVAPLEDMDSVGDEYLVVARATNDWQRFESNRAIYNGRFDWHTLEGPNVIAYGGRLYCLYSGGCWMNDTYGVDYVTSSSPMSPYLNDAPDAPRVLRTISGRVIGPGHNSLVEGPGGHTYLAYHAWDRLCEARRFCLDRLEWTADGPRCQPTVPEESTCV